MKKLAAFVEGYTELVFLQRLIRELVSPNRVLIHNRRIRRGGKSGLPRSFGWVEPADPEAGQEYFVLIYDCGNDELVKQRIKEEYGSLAKQGFTKIIGLRDVYPSFTYSDVPKVEYYMPLGIKTNPIQVEVFLCIMEVEAWFLAEYNHFPRISASITVPNIIANCGFDPTVTEDMERRPNPAADMVNCYQLGSVEYKKGEAKDTVDALDYEHIYLTLKDKIPYLDRLIGNLEAFLTS
jgi:hypothetical protein